MALGFGSYGLGLAAGVLSTLSPCVLPLIPLVVAAALAAHRRGPWMLAAGLALSYATVGTLTAYAVGSLGFDQRLLRDAGAAILAAFGLSLLFSSLRHRYERATSSLGDAGHRLLERLQPAGLSGQFLVGIVLGVVWTPCVGPTLGAAIGLASQGHALGSTALLMTLFALGAAAPLLLIGLLSHTALNRIRQKLVRSGNAARRALGALLLALAVGMVTGVEQQAEGWLLDHSPAWLTQLTTRL